MQSAVKEKLISLYVHAVWDCLWALSERHTHVKTVLIERGSTQRSYFCRFIGLKRLNTHTCVCLGLKWKQTAEKEKKKYTWSRQLLK